MWWTRLRGMEGKRLIQTELRKEHKKASRTENPETQNRDVLCKACVTYTRTPHAFKAGHTCRDKQLLLLYSYSKPKLRNPWNHGSFPKKKKKKTVIWNWTQILYLSKIIQRKGQVGNVSLWSECNTSCVSVNQRIAQIEITINLLNENTAIS